MSIGIVDLRLLVLAGLAAGFWVLVSGMIMAAVFGYRDMKAAFDAVGLQIPRGLTPFVSHTVVRLLIGMGVVALYALFIHALSPAAAVVAAAGFMWVFGTLLPFLVMVQWGLFSRPVAIRLWTWSLGEIVIAALIARLLYHV